MHLRDDRRAFADSRRDPLCGARPDIADREDARPAGLKRQSGRPARHDEPFVVGVNAAPEPLSIGIGADEEEDVTQLASARAAVTMTDDGSGETVRPVAFKSHTSLPICTATLGNAAMRSIR